MDTFNKGAKPNKKDRLCGQEGEVMGDKKAIVSVLTELEKMLRNGENFESIVKRWADSNPGVPAIEEGLREAYALTLGAAIKYFQSVS